MRKTVARVAATLALGTAAAIIPMSGVATASDNDGHGHSAEWFHSFMAGAGSFHNVGGPNGISSGGGAGLGGMSGGAVEEH